MQAFGESALIGGLVAHVESKVPFPLRSGATFLEHDHFLHDLSALTEPVMLGETVDQDVFGGRGGFVFAAQILEKVVEGVLAFGREDEELAAEAVFEAILGRDGFALLGGGTGGVLGVFVIDFGARAGGGGRLVEVGSKVLVEVFVEVFVKALGGRYDHSGFGSFGEFASAALFGATDLAGCHL